MNYLSSLSVPRMLTAGTLVSRPVLTTGVSSTDASPGIICSCRGVSGAAVIILIVPAWDWGKVLKKMGKMVCVLGIQIEGMCPQESV